MGSRIRYLRLELKIKDEKDKYVDAEDAVLKVYRQIGEDRWSLVPIDTSGGQYRLDIPYSSEGRPSVRVEVYGSIYYTPSSIVQFFGGPGGQDRNYHTFVLTKRTDIFSGFKPDRGLTWQRISEAKNVAALASDGKEFFAVTKDNDFYSSINSDKDEGWKKIETLPWKIVSMATSNGYLYAITEEGDLWTHPIATIATIGSPAEIEIDPSTESWNKVGRIKLASHIAISDEISTRLRNILGNGSINKIVVDAIVHRNLQADEIISIAANDPSYIKQYEGDKGNILAMTATGGKLFVATRGYELWGHAASKEDTPWFLIGSTNRAVALAGINGKLFGVNNKRELCMQVSDGSWSKLNVTNPIRPVTMTGVPISPRNGLIYAVTNDGFIWTIETPGLIL
jgi:hypothetical protein